MKILDKPYTNQELRQHMDGNGIVTGLVAVPVSDIIGTDLEGFLDMVSEKLTGSPCLMGTDYKAVSIENPNTADAEIVFEVTGDASMVLDEE